MVSVKQGDFEECWMRSGYERITGSLSNYDDDHNDNFKKQFVLWAKQQLCSCIMLFVHFFDFHCTTTTRHLGWCEFYRGRGHTTKNSPFSFWTSIKFLIIQLQEKSPAFHILRGFKYTRLSLKERKFIFWRRFHCQSSSSLPKLPNVPMTGYADLLCLSHLLCSIDNKHSLLKDVITRVTLQEHQRSWTKEIDYNWKDRFLLFWSTL